LSPMFFDDDIVFAGTKSGCQSPPQLPLAKVWRL
jgi:hypothetical protein